MLFVLIVSFVMPNQLRKPVNERLLTNQNKESSCNKCMQVVKSLKPLLEKQSEQRLDTSINKICKSFPPSFNITCDEIVTSYLPQILNLINQNYESHYICRNISFCKTPDCKASSPQIVNTIINKNNSSMQNMSNNNIKMLEDEITDDSGKYGANGQNVTYTFTAKTGLLRLSGEGDMYHSSNSNIPWRYYRKYIKTIIIDDGITLISNFAFAECSSLESVTIGNGIDYIGEQTFYKCTSLISISFSNNIQIISINAFHDCCSLSSINLPSSLTKISNSAFENCSSLKSLILPDKLETINYEAFKDCSSLEYLSIGRNLESLFYANIQGCISLKTIDVNENNQYLKSIDGVLFTIESNIILTKYPACKKEETYEIPNDVYSIDKYAFESSVFLKKIIIPNSVNILDEFSFFKCNVLEIVDTGDGITTIKSYAFGKCSSLMSLTLGCNINSINNDPFLDCFNVTFVTLRNEMCIEYYKNLELPQTVRSITIDGCVTSIYPDAFNYLKGLETLNIGDSVIKIFSSAFTDCTDLINVTLGKNVSTIDYHAFYCCSNLKTINFPHSITSIDSSSFAGCANLTTIEVCNDYVLSDFTKKFKNCETLIIGIGITSIADETFYYMEKLKTVIIGNTVTKIGSLAFERCVELLSVSISESVTFIDEKAFDSCNKLLSFVVSNNNPKYASEDGVLFTKKDYTQKQKNLNLLQDSFESIVFYPRGKTNSFYIVPQGVISIGNHAFSGCKNIKTIFLGQIESIGNSAFYDCTLLSQITYTGKKEPAYGSSVFAGCYSINEIIVPLDYVGDYFCTYDVTRVEITMPVISLTPSISLTQPENNDYSSSFDIPDEIGSSTEIVNKPDENKSNNNKKKNSKIAIIAGTVSAAAAVVIIVSIIIILYVNKLACFGKVAVSASASMTDD